jgi:hypothetical protein
VKSFLTEDFLAHYRQLPAQVREQARSGYQRWKTDPWQRALQFKRVHPSEPIYSVRVGLGWRAVGMLRGDTVSWFWIGSHAEYDALLKRL